MTKAKKKTTKKTPRQTGAGQSSDGFEEVGGQIKLDVGAQIEGTFMGIKPQRSQVNDGIFHVIALKLAKGSTATMTAGTVLFGRLLAGRPSIGDTIRIKREKDIETIAGLANALNFRVWIKREGDNNVPLVFDNVEIPPQLPTGDTK